LTFPLKTFNRRALAVERLDVSLPKGLSVVTEARKIFPQNRQQLEQAKPQIRAGDGFWTGGGTVEHLGGHDGIQG
jgi:hypothetical protein